MYSYSVIQWLFFFYFYCFAGWCFESAYVSLKSRRLVNRGFMRGPFLPIYGSGAIMMLVVSMPFQDHILLVYLAGCAGATVLELVTGIGMESLFKVRYWDYSSQRFNYKGYICLSSTLAWGFLTIAMTEVIHKPVERLVLAVPSGVLTAVTVVLTVVLSADFALSFQAALDLRDIILKAEEAKAELNRLQKRLDVILAVAEGDISARREELEESISARREELEENISARREELEESIRLRREALEARVREMRGSIKNLIRSNPTMTSNRFRETLEDLKERVRKK